MTGMRIRDLMLAAALMSMIVVTITLQLSMASYMASPAVAERVTVASSQ